MSESILVVIDTHGIYLPQIFAQYCREAFNGYDHRDIAILLVGPDHEFYWEAWERVMDTAYPVDKGLQDWYLYQDGDLWLVPPDYDPESEGA